ncbi:hypothetical protein [Microcoleus sp. CZ3-B4]
MSTIKKVAHFKGDRLVRLQASRSSQRSTARAQPEPSKSAGIALKL